MKILLDTHSFLWFIGGSSHLSSTARQLIEETTNQPFLSIASLWEMAIKLSLGKLSLGQPFAVFAGGFLTGLSKSQPPWLIDKFNVLGSKRIILTQIERIFTDLSFIF